MKTRMAAACAFILMVVPVWAQQVSVNYNHSASFAQYHTYAWGSNNTNAIRNSILAQVAEQDIENAMSQKGLQKVSESQNPDLILTASGGEREQTCGMPGACVALGVDSAGSAPSRTWKPLWW